MTGNGRTILWLMGGVSCCLWIVAMGQAVEPRVAYEPTWESLDRHATPEWLMDGKLGLFVYGVQATEAEWRAYWTERGEPEKKYNYRRLARDSGTWDPEGLAELAVDMGARYLTFGIGYPFVDYPRTETSSATTASRASSSLVNSIGE